MIEYDVNIEEIDKEKIMPDNSYNNQNLVSLSKKDLWNKAGSSDHITRQDVGVREPVNNSGMQALNEGYLGVPQTFSLNEEVQHKDTNQ